jgi:hypothetical protein
MAKPGGALKRPVGSKGPFGEHAGFAHRSRSRRQADQTGPRAGGAKDREAVDPPVDTASERKAALAYEREENERERAREEATARREEERRQVALDKAQASLDRARREHEDRASASKPSGPRSTNEQRPRTPAGRGRTR